VVSICFPWSDAHRLFASNLPDCGVLVPRGGPGRALQLGETRQQLLARHGAPGAEDHARNLAMYFWEDGPPKSNFRARRSGNSLTAGTGIYRIRKSTRCFRQTGERPAGAKLPVRMRKPAKWSRDDGAFASCARTRPLSIVFETGLVFADSPTSPATPAAGQPSPNAAPEGAKMKSMAVVEPELPVADGPRPSPAKAEGADSLPKLPVKEMEASSDAPGRPDAAPKIADQPSTGATLPRPAQTPRQLPNASLSTSSRVFRFGWGILAFAGFGAVAGWVWKRRRNNPPRQVSPGLPDCGAMPDLAHLRGDQFELLVAEIFRREGCTVELSAAQACDDAIDLTLRRDSETILVQCKHWQMAEVGATEMRAFGAAMAAGGAPRGIIVTTESLLRKPAKSRERKISN